MLLSMWVAMAAAAASPVTTPERPEGAAVLSPTEMFELADVALGRQDLATAESVYRALSSNPGKEVRNEARFRLAMALVGKRRFADGALLFRQILDEEPGAGRVRLELASALAAIGDEKAARRELRAARAAGLPADVLQMVDRFALALRARKPWGGSFQVAVADDSNINRATRSDSLGTVIGDFTLDEDAKARSGKGLSVQGQAYVRRGLTDGVSLLVSASGSGNFYRARQFNDMALGLSAGPELSIGRLRVNGSVGGARRWFGGSPFTDSASVRLDVSRALGRFQLSGAGAVNRIWNHRNRLESGWSYSGSGGLEFALSSAMGGGISATLLRQDLEDPGYSATTRQLSLFAYRELGQATITGAFTLGGLKTDRRLLLYRDRRDETLTRATLGTTWRRFQFGGFAPRMSVTWERNRSDIEIYDYRRTVFDVGVTRAF
jgi:outer membrane protein